ncbi:MAG: hypothetical protein MJZ06_03655 [Bacteroidaceae bacterium]|nr:hypothetical protein [Bacteroidaceae bacterium]
MKKILLLLSIPAFFLLAGCVRQTPDGPDDPGNNGGDIEDDKPFFTADIPDEYNTTCPEQGRNFLIRTNISDWTASSDADWCRTNIIKGEDYGYELDIIVDEFAPRTDNGDYDYCQPRVCTVTIKAGSTYSHTLTVRQESRVIMSTDLYGKSVFLDPAGETIQMFIRTNCISWTPSSDADWLSVKRIDNATLELSSTARKDSDMARKATVTVVSDLDSYTSTSRTSFTVADADVVLSGDDYGYGDHIDWD